MGYSLRPATDADKAWLDELRRAAYGPLFRATWGGWDEERHQRHFAASWEQGCIQVVEIDGRPVGMIQVLAAEDGSIVVREVQVLPDCQNAGIGTRLLLDVLRRARREERDVALATGLRNVAAIRLYERLGFVETERTDTHVHLRCFVRDVSCAVVQADQQHVDAVSAVLLEAARWMRTATVRSLWPDEDLTPETLRPDIDAGRYYVALVEEQPAGVVRLTTEDPVFWPEAPAGAALYVHRLAVSRRFAGRGLSTAILRWCVELARSQSIPCVRLDCDRDRPALRRVYEDFGFRHHSDRTIGEWRAARYELPVRPQP